MTRTGAGYSTTRYWFSHRASNGHPDRLTRLDGVDYYDEVAFTTWRASFQASKRAGVSRLDDGGDPDELVGTSEVARMLGYASSAVILAYLHKQSGAERPYFPEPDHTETTPGGRVRRYWQRRTVWSWARGRGTRTAGRRAQ